MKKLLIATTALVATAGMASADITISGHAAAGIHSGLDYAANAADATAATAALKVTSAALEASTLSAATAAAAAHDAAPTGATLAAQNTAQAAYEAAKAADAVLDAKMPVQLLQIQEMAYTVTQALTSQ